MQVEALLEPVGSPAALLPLEVTHTSQASVSLCLAT